MMTTMASTIRVEIQVSFHVVHVTFSASARTCRRKSMGLTCFFFFTSAAPPSMAAPAAPPDLPEPVFFSPAMRAAFLWSGRQGFSCADPGAPYLLIVSEDGRLGRLFHGGVKTRPVGGLLNSGRFGPIRRPA